MPTPAQLQRELELKMVGFARDPLGFVRYAYPWGEPGGRLETDSGPREWQASILAEIGDNLRSAPATPVRIAVASGHGIGKSALVSWIAHWACATFPDAKVVLTANTEQQMRTKTWPEVTKWYELLICKHWFSKTDTAIYSRDPEREKTWRADRVTWSDNNTEAFAGLHNRRKRIVLIFDEASAISDKVWEVAEGALTDADTEIIWIAFGNPTQNTGRFRECFGVHKARWSTRQIDSRTVPGVNVAEMQRWADDYGDDSDFFRVRVKGEFPRAGDAQFIPSDIVEAAAKREAVAHLHEALVLGVDVARHGDDMTVIYPRRGRDGRTHAPVKLRIPDLMQISARVLAVSRELHADAIFVDQGGMGVGVVDRLNQLGAKNVFGIDFGGKADGTTFDGTTASYANKRAEMWGNMRAWLRAGAVPNDPELKSDLIGPQYHFNIRNEILIEAKDDMKARGLSSPDIADALALTFAYPAEPQGGTGSVPGGGNPHWDFDPYAEDRA